MNSTSSTPWSSWGAIWGQNQGGSGQTRCGGLERCGNNVIRTGKYDITITNGEVRVVDRTTGKSVRVWGDPHIETSDGDKLGFQTGNLTFDLDDGTKITLKPTELRPDGTSLIDQVSIMNGGEAVVVTGVSGPGGPQFGDIGRNAAEVDRAFDDGTVLRMGAEVDDLFSAATGREFVGGDPNARFGEYEVSNQGGKSLYDFAAAYDVPIAGGDIYSILFQILAKIEQRFAGRVAKLLDLQEQRDKLQREQDDFSDELKKKIEGGGELSADDKAKRETLGRQAGNLDAEIKRVQFDIQRLEQEKQQITTLASNLLRSDFDTKIGIIRNIGGR